jgi:hypothetical protein
MIRWHFFRNFQNDCPPIQPPTNACTPDGRSWEQDRHGDKKFRGSDGSECIYGPDGNLDREGSFNYCADPWTLCHVLFDVAPVFFIGDDYAEE